MRFQCSVAVQSKSSNRQISHVRGSVQIGMPPPKRKCDVKPNDPPKRPLITVSTVKDKTGKVFRISDNNTELFARFVKEGKLTILFKEQNQYLYISGADPSDLNLFLKLVRAAISGENIEKMRVAKPAKTKDLEPKVTRLIVSQKTEYPFINGFPATLETMEISGFTLQRIDPRWNKLKRLSVLKLANLSLWNIADLWSKFDLSLFPSLRSLDLSKNGLSQIPEKAFKSLPLSLNQLDLSSNQLIELPDSLSRFKRLRTLQLNDNKLKLLPASIGSLQTLSILKLANNRLTCLPGALCKLRMNELDLTGNLSSLYSTVTERDLEPRRDGVVPSLFECVAVKVIKDRLPRSPLSWDVRLYLAHEFESCSTCLSPTCPSTKQTCVSLFDMRKISSQVTTINGAGRKARIRASCCSDKCANNFT